MKRSTDRTLTTHTGSLPRPADLTEMLARKEGGESIDGLDARVSEAVIDVVQRQVAAGLNVVNDGEASKYLYSTYVTERLEGFGPNPDPEGDGAPTGARPAPELLEFGEHYMRLVGGKDFVWPVCTGPVSYRDLNAVQRDIDNLKRAVSEVEVEDVFMTAVSPGCIALFLDNRYYDSHEEYVFALAEAMKPEYDAIHAAGFLLQLDCPDLASAPFRIPDWWEPGSKAHVDAINLATRDIPPDRMRMHLCWGNVEGPHTDDVPLRDIIESVLKARPDGILFEASNPRHAHEWRVFEEVELPPGKVLIPGVIDSVSNFVEHPRLVADRIEQFARLVGHENVIAGTDCGFATAADNLWVHPKIVWAKLGALAEGAELASRELYAGTGG